MEKSWWVQKINLFNKSFIFVLGVLWRIDLNAPFRMHNFDQFFSGREGGGELGGSFGKEQSDSDVCSRILKHFNSLTVKLTLNK